MRLLVGICAVLATVASCDGSSDGEDASSKTKSTEESGIRPDALVDSSVVPELCGNGGIVQDRIIAVSGAVEVRQEPNKKAERIVNVKASDTFKKTIYHRIDNSTTVRELCRQAKWSEVQIVEPEWLDHVRGWVPSDNLRAIHLDEHGVRQYVEADFYWHGDTSKHKAGIVAAANKILRENSKCQSIDPSSVAKSPSRSSPGKPVFFITCNNESDAFNVWFEPDDAAKGKTFEATLNIDQSEAIKACEAAAKTAATHPSTVDFSKFLDLAFLPHVSGRTRLVSKFTAQNALGLELKFRISCLFDGNSLIETQIAEAG